MPGRHWRKILTINIKRAFSSKHYGRKTAEMNLNEDTDERQHTYTGR